MARLRRGYTQSMRLVITSDLHYRPAHDAVHTRFAAQVAALQPDCFVIAGDAGASPPYFRAALRCFAHLPCPRLVLPGNHDLYVHPQKAHSTHSGTPTVTLAPAVDSRALWLELLPRIANEEGYGWLETQALVVGNTGICGNMAWYDYSSAPPHLNMSATQLRSFKALVNHDADYVQAGPGVIAQSHTLQQHCAPGPQLQANPDAHALWLWRGYPRPLPSLSPCTPKANTGA